MLLVESLNTQLIPILSYLKIILSRLNTILNMFLNIHILYKFINLFTLKR